MIENKKIGRQRWCFSGATVIIFAVLLSLAGCGEQNWEPREAVDFRLPLLDGGAELTLADYKGQVVYLTFWASWCVPCRQEMPYLEQLRKRHEGEGLEIIGINVDESLPGALQFAEDYNLSFPLVWDKDRAVSKAYLVPGYPTHYLVDRDGRIRYSGLGFALKDVAAVAQEVQTLLAESVDAAD
jgi:peroxiredoxin